MKIALKNCKLFDGHKDSEIKNVNILVNDDKIASILDSNEDIPDEYEIVDIKGKYVMPGLINLHAHLFGSGKPSKVLGGGTLQKKIINFCKTKVGSKVLLSMVKSHVRDNLLSGTTTLRSSGDFYYSDVKVRDMINDSKCLGPRLIVPGPAITVSGGHGDGTFALTGDSKDELEALVRQNKDNNVDYIKICVTGGVMDAKKRGEPGELKMSLEQTKIVCDLAHKYGYKVASHTESNSGVKVAIEAGVDTIEHGSFIEDNDIELYKKKGAVNVFTISPALPLAKFDSKITKLNEMCIYNSEIILEGMIDGAKKCLENNILVGLGTDASCPFVSQTNLWREVYHFAKHVGVSNQFALHTVTMVNAKILGLDNEIGSIEEGKKADLIVIENNPIEDLKNLRNVMMVMHDGKLIKKCKVKKNKYIESKLDTLL